MTRIPIPGAHRSRPAFTIVELLVVVSVIAVLMGLLLPALNGARRRSLKTSESNRIRQLGFAWSLYAQNNNDGCLPGYLDAAPGPDGESVQEAWNVELRYRFPDNTPVPMSDAAQWPWRLMSYIDFDQDLVLGHLDLEQQSTLARAEMSDYSIEDDSPGRALIRRPTHIAEEPAFGYNALYVGGWWDQWVQLTDDDGVIEGNRPQTRFYAARRVTDEQDDEWQPISVVVRSVGNIASPNRLVLFCSSSGREIGRHSDIQNIAPGSHFVVPPYLGQRAVWRRASAAGEGDISTGSATIIDVLDHFESSPRILAPVPVGRYTGQAAVLHADLHTEPRVPGILDDQRFWIHNADSTTFLHTESGAW